MKRTLNVVLPSSSFFSVSEQAQHKNARIRLKIRLPIKNTAAHQMIPESLQ